MNNKIKASILVSGFVLGGALVGSVVQVFAQNTTTTNNISTNTPTQEQPMIIKNVTTSTQEQQSAIDTKDTKDVNESNSTQDNTDNIDQSLVKISLVDAKKIAESKVTGTVLKTNLEDENNKPVYSISIGTQEIKVDATNGSIIKIEQADNKIDTDNKSNEKEVQDTNDTDNINEQSN